MQNTSLGYHTFSFFQKTNEADFSSITRDFMMFADTSGELKRFPIQNKKRETIGWEYVYKRNKGIRWLLLSSEAKNKFRTQGVMAIINPKALAEDNYIHAAQESDLELTERLFDAEAAQISPLLSKFSFCSLNRADFCLNIDLRELNIPCSPEQMMTLVKRANIPKHYKERKAYSAKDHRKISDDNSFYLESRSTVINYYWKYPQQNVNHPNYSQKSSSENVIQFEVQCKYPKLYVISENAKNSYDFFKDIADLDVDEMYGNLSSGNLNPSIPASIILSDRTAEEMVQKYFYRIIRKGDYFTLRIAKDIVKSYQFRAEKEERMLYTLEIVNQSRGIADAKSKIPLVDLDDFKRSLRDLDDILVNPVTIPKSWNIKHIPNLLRAYYGAVYEEQFIFKNEALALKRIEEFLH